MTASVERWLWRCACGWTVSGTAPTVEAAAAAGQAALTAHAARCPAARAVVRQWAALRRERQRLWAEVERLLSQAGVAPRVRQQVGKWLQENPHSWDLETAAAVVQALVTEPWLPRGVGEGTRRRLQTLLLRGTLPVPQAAGLSLPTGEG